MSGLGNGLSQTKRALLLIDRLEARIRELEAARAEPIALIGMACKFAGGADDPEAFWRLLAEGRSGIVGLPASRPELNACLAEDPATPGAMYMSEGGFLDSVDGFDADFFRISPREAAQMDPQQRIFLEVGWRALENAGLSAERLKGTRTAVYAGVLSNDYANLGSSSTERIDAHYYTGVNTGFISGRLSYFLGLHGPSITVDTTCSSALVAVHLGCQSLRSGESDLVLAGGVNVILTPDVSVFLCKAGVISPTGVCRAFDQSADGIVRGEGCGIVAMKRLSEAVADGDRVLAVIRGSAVNHDGASGGLTVPDPKAQSALYADALREAGLSPTDVSYVEAHGTGTNIGDPIELHGLSETYCANRAATDPLLIGSVKPNVGHTDSAAGIANLIKAIQILRHGQVPPSLHFETPNVEFDWKRHPIRVVNELRELPASDRPRVVGASAFGLSGINAHVLLEEYRAPDAMVAERPDRPHLLALSARDPDALRALVQEYTRLLTTLSTDKLEATCSAELHRRSHHTFRLAVVGETPEELRAALQEWLRDESTSEVVAGQAQAGEPARLAFLFSGQGGQWWAMGRELMRREPVFRSKLEEIEALFVPLAGWSLLECWNADEADSHIHETAVAQPALFALQVGMTELWKELGVVPKFVLGHSMGEVAAAHVAGALSLEDAVTVIYHRAHLLERSTGEGKMAATGLTVPAANELLGPFAGKVSLAAENGPKSLILSGESEAMDQIAALLAERNVFHRELRVKFASHCTQMEAHQAELARRLKNITARTPSVPLVSSVTGAVAMDGVHGAAYWAENIRAPVLFATGMTALLNEGADAFVEIDPHPILANSIRQCLEEERCEAIVAGSLQRERGDSRSWLESVARLFVQGAAQAAKALYPDRRLRAELPHHPWQRRRHWIDTDAARDHTESVAARTGDSWFGRRLPSPLATTQFEARWSVRSPADLADHRVAGSAVVPGAAYITTVLSAARSLAGEYRALSNVTWLAPLTLGATTAIVQFVLHAPNANGERRFEAFSTPSDDAGPWRLHATGSLTPAAATSGDAPLDLANFQGNAEHTSADSFYAGMLERGYEYAGRFRCVRELWLRDGEVLALLDAEAAPGSLTAARLDGCLHAVMAAVPLGSDGLYLPMGLDRFVANDIPAGPLFCHARVRPGARDGGELLAADLRLVDGTGCTVGLLEGLQLRRTDPSLLSAGDETDDACHQVTWKPRPIEQYVENAGASARQLVFVDESGFGAELCATLRSQGRDVLEVRAGDALALGADPTVDPLQPDHFVQLLDSLGDDALAGTSILWLFGLDAAERDDDSADALLASEERVCGALLHLLQALGRRELSEQPHLWIVTRGAQPANDATPALAAPTALWGLGRVMMWELPNLPCTFVDLEADARAQADLLLHELRFNDGETLLAFRGGERLAARFEPLALRAAPSADASTHLTLPSYGSLADLRHEPCTRPQPGAGEVVIEVRAAALNFRDALSALGMLEDYARERGVHSAAEMPFGHECSGVVTAVGEGVTKFAPGDEVVAALAPGSLDSHVLARSAFVIEKPPELSFEDAATLPIAFLTAWYSLLELGRIGPGDRVLIHCATGGVGQAAVQLARRAGAEIYATASKGKWKVLEELGIEHRYDSRTLDFADQIRADTNGAGVDYVLSSLKGEFAEKSLELVAQDGRFVEIGKLEILSPEEAQRLRPDVEYSIFDLERSAIDEPDRVGALFAELRAALVAGELSPLPRVDFASSDVEAAFRHMAQAKHIGKVVLRSAAAAGSSLDPAATYLVIGGLGGLGLNLAGWLADQGARHLTLAGRRTPNAATAVELDALRARGVTVDAIALDVSSETAVDAAVATIEATGAPLKGIFHCAVHLDDGILLRQSVQRFRTVMEAKVAGTWNLHRATRALPLDHFVCFSSIVSVLGSPGQGNYAAASAFQDQLMHVRRTLGLPGLTINWGPWAEIGRAASMSDEDSERWRARGVEPLAPERGFALLGSLLANEHVEQAIVVPIDGARYLDHVPHQGLRSFFEALSAGGDADEGQALTQELQGLTPEAARALLSDHVRGQIARVLNLPDVNRILPRQRLFEMGLDSLMAVELKNRLEQSLERSLPATVVFDYPTLELLGEFLAGAMNLVTEDKTADAAADADEDLDGLSEEDLAKLLAQELGDE